MKLPEGHQEEKVNLPEQYKMCTPPRHQRVSHSPTELPVPPGLTGLAVHEGQQSSARALVDKKSFMTLCEARLKTVYRDIEQDYDKVHGTEGSGDVGETTQEGREFDREVKSTGTGERSVLSNNSWTMAGSRWEPKEREDPIRAGQAAQPDIEMPEMPAYDFESSTSPFPDNLVDPERPVLFPEDEEWKSPPRSEAPPDKRTHMEFVEGMFQKDGLNPLTFDAGSGVVEPLAINMAWKDETDPEWTRIRTVMDSGAAESVGPPSMAPEVPIRESPGSLAGRAYIAAGGERLPNMGQKVLTVVTS